MITLINIGRFAMMAWVIYSLLLIFAPSVIHRQPDQMGGIIQFLIAYAAGYSMDRALSVVRRRKAALSAQAPPTSDTGNI
ncbi:MAG TPA: hypothetical protein VHW95_01720 [Steroidobacteraceae bacterium]|nr:hypothetical protein [Steroidobacteraceae bacterium]